MTAVSWVFAAMSVVFALTDWWATHAERPSVRLVSKPATLAALIGVAVAVDPSVSPAIRAWMVMGLVLSLAGDVFLMLDERWFLAGLGAFLLGHIAYVVGLQLAPTSTAWTLVGLAVVAASIAIVGRPMLRRLASGAHRDLLLPVIAYAVVISAMVVSAFGTAAPWAIVGAGLFYVSDGTLAWNRLSSE